MDFISTFKQDLIKYRKYSDNSHPLKLLLLNRSLRAIMWFRIFSSIYKRNIPYFLKKPLLFIGLLIKSRTITVSGIDIPYSAKIGKGFYIGHFGNIILNANSEIGENCNISQGVTIGVSGRNEKRGVPIIGDNVYVGTNAVIAGKIKVGNNVLIGANTLVTFDVPDNATVVGSPGEIINYNGSKGYI